MRHLNAIIDVFKEQQGLQTDTEVADWLGMSRQQLSHSKKSGQLPDRHCEEIAKGAKVPLCVVLLAREADKETNRKFSDEWETALWACQQFLSTSAFKDYRKYLLSCMFSVLRDSCRSSMPVIPCGFQNHTLISAIRTSAVAKLRGIGRASLRSGPWTAR